MILDKNDLIYISTEDKFEKINYSAARRLGWAGAFRHGRVSVIIRTQYKSE